MKTKSAIFWELFQKFSNTNTTLTMALSRYPSITNWNQNLTGFIKLDTLTPSINLFSATHTTSLLSPNGPSYRRKFEWTGFWRTQPIAISLTVEQLAKFSSIKNPGRWLIAHRALIIGELERRYIFVSVFNWFIKLYDSRAKNFTTIVRTGTQVVNLYTRKNRTARRHMQNCKIY